MRQTAANDNLLRIDRAHDGSQTTRQIIDRDVTRLNSDLIARGNLLEDVLSLRVAARIASRLIKVVSRFHKSGGGAVALKQLVLPQPHWRVSAAMTAYAHLARAATAGR